MSSRKPKEFSSPVPEDLMGLGADETMWPTVRAALAEGAKEAFERSQSPAYAKAVALARMNGLWEKARADPRWAAEGLLDSQFDGRDDMFKIMAQSVEGMGLKWSAVAPWALEGWTRRIQAALVWDDPLGGVSHNMPMQDRMWTWMLASLKLWSKGYEGVAGGAKAPLSGAWDDRMLELWVQFRAKSATSESRERLDKLMDLAPELGGSKGINGRLDALHESRLLAKAARPARAKPSSRL